MKKLIAIVLALGMSLGTLSANEGMWLPIFLNQNFAEMKAMGLKLSPEDIYDVNNGSLKDAVVSLGGFCTAEVVSDQGLLLTNHHCGYDAIQTHSSPEHDYLSDGFWSASLEEELRNEGLYARFLVRMEDVTNRVLDSLSSDLSQAEREQRAARVGKQIAAEATEGTAYTANVKSFYHGNEFYLFVYKTYRDVRLVGAPPQSVGKFGGDTDNWMWPRHTGDFSFFRIYAGEDNEPARYSEDNVPYQPQHALPISMRGVDPGDFTMVMGFPGSTDRYLTSYGVKQAIDKYNPTVVKIRDKKLDIMKRYMDADKATQIKYASKYAQTANYWKYYIGQTKQLKQNNVYEQKKAIEEKFSRWVKQDPQRQKKYGDVLSMFEEAYQAKDDYVKSNVYVLEAGLIGPEIPLFAFRMDRLLGRYLQIKEKIAAAETDSAEKALQQKMQPRMEALKNGAMENATEFYGDYNAELDQELMANLFGLYFQNIPQEQQPEFLAEAGDKYKGNFQKYARKVFKKTFLTDSSELAEFFEKPKQKTLDKDPAIEIGRSLYERYQGSNKAHAKTENKLDKAYRLWTAGLREMNPDKHYAPDANSTMRVTYGTVGGYKARDAVRYQYYTTAQGILQKMDNNDPEFKVPAKLASLIRDKNYGPYANDKGELPVCFIHNTDITGGNSGSPVINAHGELIGTAFDGNWEAMSGDIYFENELQRTISVDIRYTLFIVDKYANASRLIDEMNLVYEAPQEKSNTTEEAPAEKESMEANEM
ncbi:MAG: S46 family peptidase [Schleiferiaceae bacterium]|nr:S46 family peptidase [Schleiferiaceae bacterium]